MALADYRLHGRGMRVIYIHNANLIGNRRKPHLEFIITDLEYADNMVLVADSWDDPKVMLDSLAAHCKDLGLYISCNKTKNLAVI